jgi:tetratricopeptide (TPR) repeat protein
MSNTVRILCCIILLVFITSGRPGFGQGKYISEYERLYERALAYYEQKDFENALISVNKSIEAYPGYSAAYLLRAQILELNKHFDEALLNYNLYLEWEPDNKYVVFMKSLLLYRLKRFDEAITDFNRILNLKSTETNFILFKQSNFESGVNEIFTTEKNSNDYIYHYIALCYIGKEMYQQAIQFLDSAILQNASAPDYYYHRGLAKEKSGNMIDAISDYENCLEINPEHAYAKYQLTSLSRNNDYSSESYLVLLNENVSRYPEYPFPYLERAYHFMRNKNYAAALQDFNSAISRTSEDSDAYLNRGIVKEHLQDFKGAEKDYLSSIKLEIKNEKAYLNLGNLYVHTKQYDKSLYYYGLAIFYQADYALAYYNRAIAYYYLKQNNLACEDLIKAKLLLYEPAENTYIRMCR